MFHVKHEGHGTGVVDQRCTAPHPPRSKPVQIHARLTVHLKQWIGAKADELPQPFPASHRPAEGQLSGLHRNFGVVSAALSVPRSDHLAQHLVMITGPGSRDAAPIRGACAPSNRCDTTVFPAQTT